MLHNPCLDLSPRSWGLDLLQISWFGSRAYQSTGHLKGRKIDLKVGWAGLQSMRRRGSRLVLHAKNA